MQWPTVFWIAEFFGAAYSPRKRLFSVRHIAENPMISHQQLECERKLAWLHDAFVGIDDLIDPIDASLRIGIAVESH